MNKSHPLIEEGEMGRMHSRVVLIGVGGDKTNRSSSVHDAAVHVHQVRAYGAAAAYGTRHIYIYIYIYIYIFLNSGRRIVH